MEEPEYPVASLSQARLTNARAAERHSMDRQAGRLSILVAMLQSQHPVQGYAKVASQAFAALCFAQRQFDGSAGMFPYGCD